MYRVHIVNSAESEKEDLDPLSELVKSIECLLKSRIKRLRGHMKTIYPSVLKNKQE